MKRFVTLDILRGASILCMIFLHLVTDLYDMSWIGEAAMDSHPLFDVILLIVAVFFGSWAGLFLMVSATSNTVSMQGNLEKGSTVKSVVVKQVVGGLILLLFAFLAEGTLQYYALFRAARNFFEVGTPIDFTMMIWRGFMMETIQTIAWCMIINGVVHGLLCMNKGHLKAKRNLIIYGILVIVVVIATQPIWDFCKAVAASNGWGIYPYQDFGGDHYADTLSSINASFLEYVVKFFLLPLGGRPEPVFPFLAVSFLGSMIGIAITRKDVSRDWPRWGNLIGVFIMVAGVVVFVVGGLVGTWDLEGDLMTVLLPISPMNFSMFTDIFGGFSYGWLPWILIITGGQVSMMCICFRLIEHRGNSKVIAEKTKFIRKFGQIPFTFYTFHRTFAMVPLALISLIPILLTGDVQNNVMIDAHNLNGWVTLGLIAICLLFMYGIALLWEKVDYIGSLEWMIGTIGAYLLGTPKKSEKRVPWYRWGARDQQAMFYKADWVTLFEKGDNGGIEFRDSKLAMKMAIGGYFFPVGTLMGFSMYKTALKTEGENKYAKAARVNSIIAAIVNITLITVLYIIPWGILGISL